LRGQTQKEALVEIKGIGHDLVEKEKEIIEVRESLPKIGRAGLMKNVQRRERE